jgi:SpoVK/Ycf46/Vps4 family AAA+-type ATPase
MFKFNNYFFITMIASISLVGAEVPINDGEPIEAEIARTLDQLDALINRMPAEKTLELKMLQERRQRLRATIEIDSNAKNNDDVKKECAFEPKLPKELTEEERGKDVLARIKEKFIGDIPPEMLNAILFFKSHKNRVENNIRLSNKVLLHGEPGTGKTYLFEVMAQELQLPYISLAASSVGDKFMGEAPRKLREVFADAKKSEKPFLIFIDEIDAIATKRKDTTHDERRGTLMTLLTEVQEIAKNNNVFIVVATNDVESLDDAISDRFSVSHMPRLNCKQREELIMKLFKDAHLPPNAELAKRLAEATEKYSCSYLPDSEKNLNPNAQKKYWKECSFSNRDLETMVFTAQERQVSDCELNPGNCTKSFCFYLSQAMNARGKTGKEARGRRPLNCDNMN